KEYLMNILFWTFDKNLPHERSEFREEMPKCYTKLAKRNLESDSNIRPIANKTIKIDQEAIF
ncbi:22723_t:CDS:1, partial [Racocetra persica]